MTSGDEGKVIERCLAYKEHGLGHPRPIMAHIFELSGYLRQLLSLEPWPKSLALRDFLSVAMPPPQTASREGPVVLGPYRRLGKA